MESAPPLRPAAAGLPAQAADLWDPFATAYSNWEPAPDRSDELHHLMARLRAGRRRPASEEVF